MKRMTQKAEIEVTTLVRIFIGLAFAALVIYLLFFRARLTGEQVATIEPCSTFSPGIENQGRCFGTSDCGGNDGWTLVAKFGCNGDNKYCCRLSDPDAYYPAGTLLLEITTPNPNSLSATYRVVNDGGKTSLKFETGEKGTEDYATTGLPKKGMLFFKYKPNATEKYCTLFANGNTPVQDTKDCSGGSFTTLNTVPVDYPALTHKGAKSSCDSKICTVSLFIDQRKTPDVADPHTTFTLPFQT